MPVIDVAHGTRERLWREHPRLPALPLFTWPLAGRIVVVAPHPDDETLGVGGLLCMAARRHFEIELIAVTQGEASHPATPERSQRALAEQRARERERALNALGLPTAQVTQLEIPDGGVSQCADLAQRLAPSLRGARCAFVTYRGDGHPDHEAAARAAARACAATNTPLYEYPVWTWHWAQPSTESLPWTRARRLELPRYAQQAKQAAIGEYRSQLETSAGTVIVPDQVREHFARPFEVLFV